MIQAKECLVSKHYCIHTLMTWTRAHNPLWGNTALLDYSTIGSTFGDDENGVKVSAIGQSIILFSYIHTVCENVLDHCTDV